MLLQVDVERAAHICCAVGAIRLGDPRACLPVCLPVLPTTKQITKVSFPFGSTTQIGSSPAGMTTRPPSFPLHHRRKDLPSW